MKLTIFGSMIALSTALAGVIAFADTASISGKQFGQYEEGNTLQTIKFKNQFVIPFKLLSRTEISKINHAKDDLDRMITIVFVDGKIIRAADVFAEERSGDSASDYKAALLTVNGSDVVSSNNWDALDINYCKASVILDGTKNKSGYALTINRDAHPFIEDRTSMSVNFGNLVQTKYRLSVDLSPGARPNEATVRGPFQKMPSVSCIRHSKSGNGTRVRDFITSLGATNVEVQ